MDCIHLLTVRSSHSVPLFFYPDELFTMKPKLKLSRFFFLLKECNQFQAGTNLRSKIKSNKLDETAVFGCSCRHEVPNTFFSLKRGGRAVSSN
jgi:hypothetical protein